MSDTQTITRPEVQTKTRTKRPGLWHVVLLDDDDHTYEYVVEMLGAVCGHSRPRAFRAAQDVDTRGRAIVYTAHLELAELKLDQIVNYGVDVFVASCTSSMRATLEPAHEPEPSDP
jgi:ATP-dependent Clp protease adaptor protein ClpS